MIGYYDHTVILTYLGLLCAVLGMSQSVGGGYYAALLLLCGALVCDTTAPLRLLSPLTQFRLMALTPQLLPGPLLLSTNYITVRKLTYDAKK